MREEGIFEPSTLLGWINDPFLLDSTNRGGGLLPSHLIIPTMFAVEELKSKDSDHSSPQLPNKVHVRKERGNNPNSYISKEPQVVGNE